jgi:hypothetical protein
MSVLELDVQPTGVESRFTAFYLLDGARYRLTFYTNTVDSSWYLDFENADATTRILGIGLTNGVDILYPYRHLDVPPGALFVSMDDDGDDPDLSAFAANRAHLLYVDGEA